MTNVNADHCYKCGAVIPEGRQLCPNCEQENKYELVYDKKQGAWTRTYKCEVYFTSKEERDAFEKALVTGRLKMTPTPGNWIPDEYQYYHCSKCGYEHDSPERTTKFCPECGSPMEKGDNDGEEE